MKPFFDENGFKEMSDGSFANEKKAVKVAFDDERQMYVLSTALFDEEKNLGEFAEITSWLFDDSQNEKDAVSVGIGFTTALKRDLGIKSIRNAMSGVNLPTASKSDSMDITAFTKKMLDFFPVLKDQYKLHISTYGNFLYINFFGEALVPQIKGLFTNGTAKQIKKFYDVLEDVYTKGNMETVNILIAVLCASAYKTPDIDTKIKGMLKDNSHFTLSYTSFAPILAKNKKLQEALIK